MMKASNYLAAAIGLAWSTAGAFGQQRGLPPAPTYYQGGAYPQPAPVVRPPAPAAPPVYYPPAQPVQAAPRPVYYSPQPAMTLAPAPAYIEIEEEEGIYWFWGQKWPGIALGPKIGTTGIGADLTFGINRFLNLRAGGSYGPLTWNPELGDVEYDMEMSQLSFPLLVDIHPFGNHFRISGGFYFQNSSADLTSTPNKPVQIGEHTYAPEVVGTLSGTIDVSETLVPYLGIGFGNAVGEDQLLTFMVDIGVLFQSYDVSLTSNGAGMTAQLDTFRNDIKLEEANLQSDLDNLKVYPVLTLGIAWHF